MKNYFEYRAKYKLEIMIDNIENTICIKQKLIKNRTYDENIRK